MNTLYKGERISDTEVQVTKTITEKNGERVTFPLTYYASQQIYNHSPDGFNWGYAGSGPAQLALGLLYDATKDKVIVLKHYQEFKHIFVAKFKDSWEISWIEIVDWLDEQESISLAREIRVNMN